MAPSSLPSASNARRSICECQARAIDSFAANPCLKCVKGCAFWLRTANYLDFWAYRMLFILCLQPEQKHQHWCAASFPIFQYFVDSFQLLQPWLLYYCWLLLLQILLISGAFYFNCLHRMASRNSILALTMGAKHGIPLKFLFILHIHALLPLKYFNVHGFFIQSPHQNATLLSTRAAQCSHNLK